MTMAGGTYITSRWIDLNDSTVKADDRSADEIALDVIKNAGLTFGGDTE